MKRVALLLCLSPFAFAQIQVPNVFEDGQPAKAAEVNENFDYLTEWLNPDEGYNMFLGSNPDPFTSLITDAETGAANTAFGFASQSKITTALGNTSFGYSSLTSLLHGERNTVVGAEAAFHTMDGKNNVAIGEGSLKYNITGSGNTAIGTRANYESVNASGNTSVGAGAMAQFSEGFGNVALGFKAMSGLSLEDPPQVNQATEGDGNIAIGVSALMKNTGDQNIAIGSTALQSNTYGTYNVAVGAAALGNTNDSNNTAIGTNALNGLFGGLGNTAIGFNANATGTLSNATAIGANATVIDSNQVQIGNDDIEDVYLGRRAFPLISQGEVAANLRLFGDLYVKGSVVSSDGRLKENVTAITEGLSLVNDLNPVSYHRIDERRGSIEMGLVAQEVQATLEAHNLNSGMVHQSDSSDYLYLRYNDLMAPMIKAIQELDDASEAKDKQIASLEQKLASQQEELLAIVQSQQEQIAQLQRMVEHQFAAR